MSSCIISRYDGIQRIISFLFKTTHNFFHKFHALPLVIFGELFGHQTSRNLSVIQFFLWNYANWVSAIHSSKFFFQIVFSISTSTACTVSSKCDSLPFLSSEHLRNRKEPAVSLTNLFNIYRLFIVNSNQMVMNFDWCHLFHGQKWYDRLHFTPGRRRKRGVPSRITAMPRLSFDNAPRRSEW